MNKKWTSTSFAKQGSMFYFRSHAYILTSKKQSIYVHSIMSFNNYLSSPLVQFLILALLYSLFSIHVHTFIRFIISYRVCFISTLRIKEKILWSWRDQRNLSDTDTTYNARMRVYTFGMPFRWRNAAERALLYAESSTKMIHFIWTTVYEEHKYADAHP